MGGFGEVWKASHSTLKSQPPVALKFCLDPEASRYLRHEALLMDQVMTKAHGPGIVERKNAFLGNDPPCLAFEFINGGDLCGLMHDWLRLPLEKRIPLASQLVLKMARILAPLHQLNPAIVHRDLKPSNILVMRKDAVKFDIKIADFGIGGLAAKKSLSDASRGVSRGDLLSQTLRGSHTPLYASPEQTKSAAPDPRDDVHALGVIWFQLLTCDLQRGVGADFDEDLRELKVPEATAAAIKKCVASKRERRFADAQELADHIAGLLQGPREVEEVGEKEDDYRPAPVTQRPPSQETARMKEPGASSRETEVDYPDPPLSRRRNSARKRKRKDSSNPLKKWMVLGPLAGAGVLALGILMFFTRGRNPSVPTGLSHPTLIGGNVQPGSQAPKIGDTLELPLTAGLKMKFAWVPPGKSWLGGGGGKPGEEAFTLEEGLWCGVYEVTQAEWQAVMGSSPVRNTDRPNHPVVQVSWDDVQEFLEKVNRQGGAGGYLLRLPTSDEWEYICRGGPIGREESSHDFYFANSRTDLTPQRSSNLSSHQANFDGNFPAGSADKGPYVGDSSPVGSYLPNPLGVYDLHGNVWEWTSSRWEKTGSMRVRRSSSWYNAGLGCSAANGLSMETSNRSEVSGFRIIADPVPSGRRAQEQRISGKTEGAAPVGAGDKNRSDLSNKQAFPSTINLLSFCFPSVDTKKGKWRKENNSLISDDGMSIIRIPHEIMEEYQLTTEVYKGNDGMFGIGLMTGPTQCLITLDSFPSSGGLSKFDVVDGKGVTFHRGRLLPQKQISTIRCTVKRETVVVEVNGIKYGEYRGDFRRLSVHEVWKIDEKTLFFGAIGSGLRIIKAELAPILPD